MLQVLIDNWYLNSISHQHQDLSFCVNPTAENLLLNSSSSCSPSHRFTLDPSQLQSFFTSKPTAFSALLNATDPFDNDFDLGCETRFLSQFQPNQVSALMDFGGQDFQANQLFPLPDNSNGFSWRGAGDPKFSIGEVYQGLLRSRFTVMNWSIFGDI